MKPATATGAAPALKPAAQPDAALTDDWLALKAAESDAIAARRSLLQVDEPTGQFRATGTSDPLPRVGLALSGGGIRSATFALGLLRGMAQSRGAAAGSPASNTIPAPAAPAESAPDQAIPAEAAPRETVAAGTASAQAAPDDDAAGGLLGRLDYLSTVSGGGYVGAMFGRLVATYGLKRARVLMASSRSPVLGWLRRNGRYLAPGGSRDTGIAVVTYLRAWLAIHAEFMFACIVLGLVVVAPHLWQHSVQLLDANAWEPWHTAWWALALVFWTTLAPGLIAGYWAARDAPPNAARPGLSWRDGAFVLIVAVGAALMLHSLIGSGSLDLVRLGLTWPGAGVLALASVVVGQVATMVTLALDRTSHALKVARIRNLLTRLLRWVLVGTLALAAIGALDRLSWWVLEELQTGNQWLWRGVGAGSIAVVVLRALAQPLQKIASETARARELLPLLLEVASVFGMLALVLAWLVLLQWFIFAPTTFDAMHNLPPWMRASLLAALWLGWTVLSAGNAQMANTSSLHSFYRARLAQAYLAVGNLQRDLADENGARADVTRVVEGDDTQLRSYRPETGGGPIHLINACLNQTRDDKSGLFNADRKGTAITASWRGFEVGPREFIALEPRHDAGTLGRWIAVSGAAASPGAGAYTSRGLALLLYFLGVRLGHWMRAPRERVRLHWLSDLSWRFIPKPMMLASEASATFYGVERPWWYLSDGGHFENSAVYPLLKRELDFIILSDAGADADYEFGDLENLVRKARIDFGAEIDFYTREEASAQFPGGGNALTVLSPEDMGNLHSSRGVLLARIRYRARPGPPGADGSPGPDYRPQGTLLVIKPNLHNALDIDLLAYARNHPRFPHESTGDQSFDEAQWESYHRLGEDFGRAMHEDWLARLPGWRAPASHAIRVSARLAPADDAPDATAQAPLWRRNARAAAIGTTLGVGASGTLLLSLWQVQDQLQRNRVDQQTEARQLFAEVSKGLQAFNGSCPEIAEHVVTQAALLLELSDSPSMRPLEQAGLERLAGRIAEECARRPAPSAECVLSYRRVQRSLCTIVLKPRTMNTALNYWHPGSSPREQAADATAVLQAALARYPMLAAVLPQQTPAAGQALGPTVAGRVEPAPSAPAAVAAAPAPQAAPAATSPAAPRDTQGASLDICARGDGASTLYIHIYDENTRQAATVLHQALQPKGGAALLVAPIENVARSADLRQQRRPVAWANPTLVLHDPASRDCALAIATHVGLPWSRHSAGSQVVRLRDLPASLAARPGVLELWLPPIDMAAQEASRNP